MAPRGAVRRERRKVPANRPDAVDVSATGGIADVDQGTAAARFPWFTAASRLCATAGSGNARKTEVPRPFIGIQQAERDDSEYAVIAIASTCAPRPLAGSYPVTRSIRCIR